MKLKSQKKYKFKFYLITFLTVTFLLFELFFLVGKNNSVFNLKSQRDTSNISEYNIVRKSQNSNSVTYDISYKEDNVWYWDQKKEDFVLPSWEQKTYDDWMYNETPQFGIIYEGEFDEDGNVLTIPNSTMEGWTTYQSITNETTSYTYNWINKYEKATFPKSLPKYWSYSFKDDLNLNWVQYQWDKWGWTSSAGYWKKPHRAETGLGNQSIWVDWTIYSNGILENNGKLDIEIYDNYSEQFVSQDFHPTFDTSAWSFDSSAPYVEIPEPNDGEPMGVNGSETLKISNLALGWQYTFNAKLMYKDSNGVTKQWGSDYQDKFETNKEGPVVDVYSTPMDQNSITFGYDINDLQSSRSTPVNWSLESSTGEIIETGINYSNNFEKTFQNLDSDIEYSFKINFQYRTLNRDDGTYDENNYDGSKSSKTGIYYNNEVNLSEIWVSDIQSGSFVLNLNIETNNHIIDNSIDAGWQIEYLNSPSDPYNIFFEEYTGKELNEGTNSIKIDFNYDDLTSYNLSIKPIYKGTNIISSANQQILNIGTNLKKDFSIHIINSETTNTEMNVYYELSGDLDKISSLSYKINNSNWIEISFNKNTDEQVLSFEKLAPNTEYNFQLKGVNTYLGQEIFSNKVKFKTDVNTSINFELTPYYNSAKVNIFIDKEKYLDNKNIYWELEEARTNKFIQNNIDENEDIIINSNGTLSFTIDNLNPQTQYNLYLKFEIEENIYYEELNFETTSFKTNFNVNSSVIKKVETKDNHNFKLYYDGYFRSLKYSIDETNSWNYIDILPNDNFIEFYISEDFDDSITFVMNESLNSTWTFNKSEESYFNLSKNEFNLRLFLIIIFTIFAILTLIISSLWGIWWSLKKSNSENKNIWN